MVNQCVAFIFIAVARLVNTSILRSRIADLSLRQGPETTDSTTSEQLSFNQGHSLNLMRDSPKVKGPKVVKRVGSGMGGDKVDNVLDVNCFMSFPGPKAGSKCPEECPCMRFDPDRMCHFKCITKDWCINAPNMPSSFPDENSHKCLACQVAGCAECISPTQCKIGKCRQGFDMVDGKCLSHSRHMWRVILVVILVLVLIVAFYLMRLRSRPIRQPILLKLAMAYRNLTKLRKDDSPHELYPLSMNLCTDLVSGIGTMLHFRFQAFWLAWSLVVFISAGAMSTLYGRFKAADAIAMTPTHEEVFRECNDFGTTMAVQIFELQEAFTIFTGIVYVATTIACLWFAMKQQRFYSEEEAHAVTMEDFGVCVYDMPKEMAYPNIEQDYTDFFKQKFDGIAEVIGVSICWDYSEKAEHVINHVAGQVHEADREYVGNFLKEDEILVLKSTQEEPLGGDHRSCNIPEMRCLDDLFVGSSADGDKETGTLLSGRPKDDEIKGLVSNLSTVGIVFLVLNSEEDQQEVLNNVKKNPLKFKDNELTIVREQWDPATLLWHGFSVPTHEKHKNIIWGILVVLLVIVVWAVCFYGPYVVYVLSWSKVAGQTQGDSYTMMLLGVMCAIGNQVVYAACALVADKVGFRSKDFAMTFQCCLYTMAVFINIVVDVSLMLVMAHGYQQDSGMDPAATIRNPSFQYSVYLQLVTYLYPATLLAPYLAEPLPMNIIPYYLCKWMVRSAFRISRFDAELAMECPEFDLLRYGDIIINVSTVILCFFLASSSLWWIFMWLSVSNLVIYGWDHFRFLRCCTDTFFANDRMEVCSQYISALPCALLASAYVFKRYGGKELLKSWDSFDEATHVDIRDTLEDNSHRNVFYIIIAFVVHLMIHVLVVALVLPKLLPEDSERQKVVYADYAKHTACNWFNTNPVHCLRSKYIHEHTPPYLYFIRGKEYTHKKNESIHQYYEEQHIVDLDVGIAEEAKAAFKKKKRIIEESAHHLADKMSFKRGSKLACNDESDDHASDAPAGGCSIS